MNLEELSFLIIVVVLIAFYVVLIRPSQQEQKRQQKAIRDLRTGDEVITTAGFYAIVKEIRTPEQGDIQVVLDLGNGFEVRALPSAILKRVSSAGEAAEQKDEAKA
jgi:preprotein translocase subunit YajC